MTQVIPEWTLGDRLRKARQLAGLSTQELAEAMGVSRATVNNAESGAHAVRRITLNAWSLVTGVSVEWIRDGDGAGSRARRDSNPQPSGWSAAAA